MKCVCCRREWLDFQLDDVSWKEAFSKPGGLLGAYACLSSRAYLGVRLSILLVWLACCAHSLGGFVAEGNFLYWWIYMTHWGATVELVYFALAAFTTYKSIFSEVPDGKGTATPWFARLTWALSSAAPVAAFEVFVLYWGLVFEPGPGSPTVTNVTMHGVNFALALLDLALTRQPFYLAHVFMPLAGSAAYALFTLLYHWAGGTTESEKPSIYEVLDWSQPKQTGRLAAMAVLLATPVVYILLYFVALLRRQLRQKAEKTPVTPAALEAGS